MLDRRSFLKAGGALAAVSILPGCATSMMAGTNGKFPPIGLQTFTTGYLLGGFGATGTVDVKAGLKEIASIGIKELETFGGAGGLYHGYKPKELASIINDLGMKWIGHHSSGVPGVRPPRPAGTTAPGAPAGQPAPAGQTPAAAPRPAMAMAPMAGQRNLRDNLQEIVDDASEAGLLWVVCASSAESTMDEIKQTTAVFAKAGELAKKHKMRFAYHNHQTEFAPIDGISPFNYILGQTNKNEVFMEVDLGWASAAGMNPVDMFKKYPGRFPLWHVKDIDKATGKPAPVGTGILDVKNIFANAKLAGLEHFFIEQDGVKSLEGPTQSVNFLKKNILI